MAQRKKAASVVDEGAVESAVRDELAREAVAKLGSIKPAHLRQVLGEKLVQEGFEVTKTLVRRPLQAQLRDALQHGALVPVKSLASHVRGATATELKRLAEAAVREGTARLVLRGAAEVLAGTEVRVLSGAEVEALRIRVVALGKALEKVTRKQGLSLLATDATAALSEALTAVDERSSAKAGSRAPLPAASPQKPRDDAMSTLLEAVDSTRDVRTGLSFVPAVVGRLAPGLSASAAVKLLLTAAERELLELRPEGGIGRLSEAELSVCPPGPHDTRLSWARRLTGGAT
jgi:hypothetical protein